MMLKALVGLLVVGLVRSYPMGCGGDCGDYGGWWDWGSSWGYGGGDCGTGGCNTGGCGGCAGGDVGCGYGTGCGGDMGGIGGMGGIGDIGGIGGGVIGVPGFDPGYIVPQPFPGPVDECPKIEKCSDLGPVQFTACNVTDDCLRGEACCQNPCSGRKDCLIIPSSKIPVNADRDLYLQCPIIKSCTKLIEEKNHKPCDSDEDCKRTQKCCEHPCDDLSVSSVPAKICSNATSSIPMVNPNHPLLQPHF